MISGLSSLSRVFLPFLPDLGVKMLSGIGARAYFLHSILHDWNDQDCHKILRNLADAMEPGYSKLLINENVIPDTGAHWQVTSLDLIMMADFASQERTGKQWKRLIEGAGLRICKTWTVLASAESLIECQLA